MTKLPKGVATLVVLTSLCTGSSIMGQEGESWNPASPPGWTLLKLGEKKGGFTFARGGGIEYRGQSLGKCRFNSKDSLDWEVAISPASPQKGLRLFVCWEDGRGGVDAMVVSSKAADTVARSIVPSGWGVAKWVSWAPSEQYALLFAVGEVTMGDMAVVDLRSGTAREIHFKKLVANDNELQDFEPETVKWLSPVAFRLRLDVRCNPYELYEKCDYEKVLRSSNVQVTLSPLKIEY